MSISIISLLLPSILAAAGIGVVLALVFRARAKTRLGGSAVIAKPKKPGFLDIDDSGGFRGMKSWPDAARWAAVLPLALFGILALSWFVRLFVGVFHVSEQSALFLYLLQPLGAFLSHLGFVMGGWAAAPRSRVAVAVVLGVVLAALNAALLSRGLSAVPVVAGAAGIVMAVYHAFKTQSSIQREQP